MLEKIDLSEEQKKRIINRAGELGDEIGSKFMACCPATFAAICEAFREENIELFSAEVQEIITQGMLALEGGVGKTGVGTCGAVTAATFLISSVIGVTTKELQDNTNLCYAACLPAVESIVDRFEEDYGAIDCLRLRYNRCQRAFDFTDPDARIFELLFSVWQKEKCGIKAASFEKGRDQCPPVRGARYAAETICELLSMEPKERKKVPPHFEGLGPKEIVPKLRKAVEILEELGIGRPREKISYREYRKLKTQGKEALEKERLGSVEAPNTGCSGCSGCI